MESPRSNKLGLSESSVVTVDCFAPEKYSSSKPVPDTELVVWMHTSTGACERHGAAICRTFHFCPFLLSFPLLIPLSPSCPLSVTALSFPSTCLFLRLFVGCSHGTSPHFLGGEERGAGGHAKPRSEMTDSLHVQQPQRERTDAMARASALLYLPPNWGN